MRTFNLYLALLIVISLIPLANAIDNNISSESTSPNDWRNFGRHLNHSSYTSSYFVPNISTTRQITKSLAGSMYYGSILVNNSLMFTAGSTFYSVNASNISNTIYQFTVGSNGLGPVVAGDFVYQGTDTVNMYQYNLSNLSTRLAVGTVPPSNGNAYYGSAVYDGYLYAATGNSGRLAQFNATNISQSIADHQTNNRAYVQPSIANGYVYYSSNTGKIYQLNASNVSIEIASKTIGGSNIYSSSSVTEDYVYVGSDNDVIYQLNASNVSIEVARYTTGGDVYGSPAIAHGYIYVGSADKSFYQLNASNISIQVANYTSSSSFLATAVVNDLYVLTASGTTVYQFDAFDITNVIGTVTQSSTYIGAGPTLAGGYLYVAGGAQSKIYQYGIDTPTVTQTQPIDVFHFGYASQNITFNCSVEDSSGLVNVSFYITGNTNQTFSLNQTTNLSGTINKTNWTLLLDEGNYTWACLAYDTDGNAVWSDNRTMGHDVTDPKIVIDFPSNDSNSPDVNLDINYTITDQNTAFCWYSNDTYLVNNTLTDCSDLTSATWAEGSHNVTIWANDTKGNENYTVIFFTIDITIPFFVNISNSTREYGELMNFTINASDSAGIGCYTVNDTNFTIDCAGNLENNTLLAIAQYNLNITVNDTSGNTNFTVIYINVSDTTSPNFTIIADQSVYDLDALAYDINATDKQGIECFDINDTQFTINCTGYLENATGLNATLYNLNITVNDSSGNLNYSTLQINVTTKPFIGLDWVYPTADLNVTQNELFYVSVNVSCSRADCGDLNVTLNTNFENTSDFNVAFVCYSSSCSDADDLSDYLIDEGFSVTQEIFTGWTDAELNTSAFDVMVVGGNYLVGYYAFDSSNDPTRDAFEDEGMPTVVALDTGYTPSNLGITTTTCATDSLDNAIIDIQSHPIMTGYSGTVYVDTTSDDLCYFTTSQMTDPYTKLFAHEDGGGDEISGFVVEAGDATIGTNPGNFIYLGFDTADTYPTATGNDSIIIKQATCWAASGAYDCAPKRVINKTATASPFYVNITNPNNISLTNGSSTVITFGLNATGATGRNYEFFLVSNKTSDQGISNDTIRYNISILAADLAPTLTIVTPEDSLITTDINLDINYTVGTDTLDECWYTNESNSGNISLSACANITDVVWPEGVHNITIYANDSNGQSEATVGFVIDTINPNLNIISPANGSGTSDTSLYINYSVSDANLDSCWYSNDTYSVNTTLASCANITGLTWSEGVHNLTIWVNDSAGNQNSTILFFTIDTTPPTLAFESPTPANNSYLSVNFIVVNVTHTETGSGLNNGLSSIHNSTNGLTASFAWFVSPASLNTTELDDGVYLINITAVDNANNTHNLSRNVTIDTTYPLITLNFPSNNSATTDTSLYINYSVSDINLDSCWYSNGTYSTNTTLAGCANITGLGWADGDHNLTIWVNDSAGNTNSTIVFFIIDTTTPTISISFPTNGTFTSDSSSYINYSASGTNIASCWYSNGTKSDNITLASCVNITGLSWVDGQHNVTIYVNNTAGNTNSTIVFFTVDTTYPTISITSPNNATISEDTSLYINYTVSDTNLDACWYSNSSYSVNTTLVNCINITGLSWADGTHNVTVWTNDSAGNTNYSIIWFTIDITTPNVTLLSPFNSGGDHDGNVTYEYNVVDTGNVSNCTLIFNGDVNLTNHTITMDATQYFTHFNLPAGRINWSVNCTDSLGRTGASNSWTFRVLNATRFGGITTPLNNYNLSNISYFIIEQPTRGKINFTSPVDLSEVTDINSHVNISPNYIEVNSTALSQLNVSAILVLYNLSFTNPRLLRDDGLCDAAICSQIEYSGGNLTFNVTRFSSYSAEETPATESTSSSSSSGGGGGGGGGQIPANILDRTSIYYFKKGIDYKVLAKGTDHILRITEIGEVSAVMHFFSDKHEVELQLGKIHFLDIEGDGVFDLSFKLEEIFIGKVKLEIRHVRKEVNPEITIVNKEKESIEQQPSSVLVDEKQVQEDVVIVEEVKPKSYLYRVLLFSVVIVLVGLFYFVEHIPRKDDDEITME